MPEQQWDKMIEGYVEHYGEEMLEEIAAMTGPFNLFEPEDAMSQSTSARPTCGSPATPPAT